MSKPNATLHVVCFPNLYNVHMTLSKARDAIESIEPIVQIEKDKP